METNKYAIFLKVLECRNFSKAAAELGYTQSALSHSVSSLERQFGFKLLNRENGNISLTRAGIDILPYIRSVVKAQNTLELTLQSYEGLESGTLCVASIPSLAIHHFPALFESFHERYPNIHIVCFNGGYEEVEEMLAGGRVDVGFTSVVPDMPFSQSVLFREPLKVIVPVGHPLAAREEVALKELEEYDFIMPGEGPDYQVGALIRDYNLNLKTTYAVYDDNFTVSMIAQNMGVSILPLMSVDYLNLPYAAVDIAERPSRQLGLIYNKWDTISPISRIFIKFAENFFKEQEKGING